MGGRKCIFSYSNRDNSISYCLFFSLIIYYSAFHKGHELTDFVSDALLKVASKVQSSTEHDLGLLGRKLVQTFHKHLDPTILNSVFKLISDEYGQERGICQYAPYAIHYRSYKDLIAVYDMSFAFDCPDTEEGFYEISKAITYIVERVQFYAGEGECCYYYVDFMILI